MDSVPLGDFRAFGRFLDGGMFGVGSSSVASLILDGESGELVRAPLKLGKKGGGAGDVRSAMALKSHSEAERRRRERINGHLMTLRRMTPCTDKFQFKKQVILGFSPTVDVKQGVGILLYY